MRILEAFGEPIADGGQESFVFGVLVKMDMTDLTIDCLTAYDCRSEYYKELVESKGGRVYSFNLPFAPGGSRENIRRPLREFLNEHSYDIIHIHSGSISVLAIMAAEADRAGVEKVIVHSHVDGEKDSIKHRMLRYIASLSMSRHVDTYCACSKIAAKWKFEPKYAEKTIIVKNGIDICRFAYNEGKRKRMRRSLRIDEGDYVIGHVGRFARQKNQAFLLKVFEKIIKDGNTAKLLFVGEGDDRKGLEKLAAQSGLERNVIFTGSVPNVEDYLQAMDVFVFPSLFEGLGIVAMEAQAAGLPVVASDHVPRDIAVTPHVCFLSLNADIMEWKSKVLGFRSMSRADGSKMIGVAGYDIEQTARTIRNLYVPQ